MYLRFVSPRPADRRRGAYGIFDAAWDYAYGDEDNAINMAIRRELSWFRRHLPVPAGRHFRVKSRTHWYEEGICWFRADAREMLHHAYILAALLGDEGMAIRRLRTDSPGQILYRDDWQIVAKPGEATPVHWH